MKVMQKLVLVISALLSLADAQCSDNCNCGVSACCQNSYTPASPYNLFNFGYDQQYNYQQQYGAGQQFGSGQQLGSSYGQNLVKSSCLKTSPVPISLTQIYQNQPLYTRVVEDSEDSRQVDNICLTLFPLPHDSSVYIAYESTVYSDGSNDVVTTISHDVGIGTYVRGNAYNTYTQRVFASFGNNMFIGCSRKEYGSQSSSYAVFVTSLGSVSPLGPSCVQQIQNIIQCVGQDEGGLYVLPYRLPTRCVTQQVCSLTNPLLYGTIFYT